MTTYIRTLQSMAGNNGKIVKECGNTDLGVRSILPGIEICIKLKSRCCNILLLNPVVNKKIEYEEIIK